MKNVPFQCAKVSVDTDDNPAYDVFQGHPYMIEGNPAYGVTLGTSCKLPPVTEMVSDDLQEPVYEHVF